MNFIPPAYEDGTDRVFRNVGIYNSDAGELPKRKHNMFLIMFIILSTKFTNEFPLFKNPKHSYSHVMTFVRSLYFHFPSLEPLPQIKVQRFIPTKQQAKLVLSIMLIFNVLVSRD